jgi:hypothetical protein
MEEYSFQSPVFAGALGFDPAWNCDRDDFNFHRLCLCFCGSAHKHKRQKIDNHSCDNACHIATILSNFVYHPVIWQEWYRYQAMAWPSKCQYIWFVGIGFSADNQHVSYRIYDYARSPGGY